MLKIMRFINTGNGRKYLIEYGSDLFGNLFVKIRYGIQLGIVRTYAFEDKQAQQAKLDEIIAKRIDNGYQIIAHG